MSLEGLTFASAPEFPLFFRWESLAPEGLSNLPRITQLAPWGFWVLNQSSPRRSSKTLFYAAFFFLFSYEKEEGATSLLS